MKDFILDIYSKIEKDKLLHKIVRKGLFLENRRTDLADETQFLQLAALRLDKDKTFKPHRHIWKDYDGQIIAQESWVVIQGKVKVILYDIDDTIVWEDELHPGDISMTFFGGHNYKILENDTFVYEYKTGPYYGQLLDKRFINE